MKPYGIVDLYGAKPLPEPALAWSQPVPWEPMQAGTNLLRSMHVCQQSIICITIIGQFHYSLTKFRATGLFYGNPPVTGGFPSQRASNAENVSMWWRHLGKVCVENRKQACRCPNCNKGIKNGCPCIVEIRGTQGCALVGDPARASDLHNARATILNPFYNMEYKIIKKIRQNTAWIETDILGINLTPNRYNALATAIVYVSDDVTIPFNSLTSQ